MFHCTISLSRARVLSPPLSLCLLSVSLSLSLSLSFVCRLPACLPICLSVCLSVCLFVCLYVCLHGYPLVRPSVRLSITFYNRWFSHSVSSIFYQTRLSQTTGASLNRIFTAEMILTHVTIVRHKPNRIVYQSKISQLDL